MTEKEATAVLGKDTMRVIKRMIKWFKRKSHIKCDYYHIDILDYRTLMKSEDKE